MTEKNQKNTTTVQINTGTRDLLKHLAQKGKRSMTAELSWLVEKEIAHQQRAYELTMPSVNEVDIDDSRARRIARRQQDGVRVESTVEP